MSTISRSMLVITRGGQNTTMACMMAGVPILGFPGDSAEADFNVRGIVDRGGGINCREEDLEKLPTLINEIMQPKYKESATKLGKKIKIFGGARTVVRLMEGIV